MKKKLFWGALLFISISWILNALYAQSKILKEPIFLEHNIHASIQDGNMITFYYLTNAKEDVFISSIHFENIGAYRIEDEPIQNFPHYTLRQAIVEIDSSFLDFPFTTDEAFISLSDGREMTVPIGELTFFENDINQTSPFITSGSSGGDDWNMDWYKVDENITIESLELNVHENLRKYIEVKINSPSIAREYNIPGNGNQDGVLLEDLKMPVHLAESENLYIHRKINPVFIGSIQSSLTISGRTATGETFHQDSYIYSQQPDLNHKDVLKLVEERTDTK